MRRVLVSVSPSVLLDLAVDVCETHRSNATRLAYEVWLIMPMFSLCVLLKVKCVTLQMSGVCVHLVEGEKCMFGVCVCVFTALGSCDLQLWEKVPGGGGDGGRKDKGRVEGANSAERVMSDRGGGGDRQQKRQTKSHIQNVSQTLHPDPFQTPDQIGR